MKKRESAGKRMETLTNYLFILPLLILFLTFFAYPILYNFIISFYDWNGISVTKSFAGLANYRTVMSDRVMKAVLKNFVIIALGTTLPQAFFGIIFASFFRRHIRFAGFYRIAFYLPAICTVTIVGNVFSKIFETNRGYLNVMLRSAHLDFLCQPWLAAPHTALLCILFVNIWQWTGYSMLMYYAGMLNIPDDLYEAAAIDGAGPVQQFRHITFPLLRGTHYTLVILGVLGALKCFDLPYVLTDGGPAHATETFSTYIYTKSFNTFKQGQASAIVVLMFMIAMAITVIQLKMYYKEDRDKELAE
ncbi:carbohydrate ABC transporter permease [Lachnoclostridium sp. Marseille-P6806]|uniref:carbohydrate ABC transporter permease n=1 Tax=Lachnoclostridium sp. Marseille-P6806 TaxID=2364793 RepID=UPI001F5FA089|nr:sugar ABC transporter permease [Lachnoclostridium sp. Marseille-P6806]